MTILVINPGSTSTKVSVYEDDEPILVRSIRHTVEERQMCIRDSAIPWRSSRNSPKSHNS